MNHSQSQLHHYLTSLLHSSSKSPLHLKQIHAHLIRHHLAADPHLTSLLISFSTSSPLYALSLFRHFPSRPTPPLFNAVVRALTDSSHYHLALSTFTLLLTHPHCLKPTRLSLPFAIRAAASLPSPPSTLSLHTVAIKPGFDLDPFVRTTIADSYCKLGSPELALQVFDETPEWHRVGNVILWNVGIKACCELGRLGTAREMFEAMPEKSVSSWNCLIHGFVRKGDLEYAEELFEKMPERNVFSWTTMVVGFSRSGDARRALSLFDRMVDAGGVRPNAFTVSAVLAACARVGALEAGIRIHEFAWFWALLLWICILNVGRLVWQEKFSMKLWTKM